MPQPERRENYPNSDLKENGSQLVGSLQIQFAAAMQSAAL
jgi:hypothetical protein